MSDTNPNVPLVCPQCSHAAAKVSVASQSVVTFACAECGHYWTMEIAGLPEDVRRRVPVDAQGLVWPTVGRVDDHL